MTKLDDNKGKYENVKSNEFEYAAACFMRTRCAK